MLVLSTGRSSKTYVIVAKYEVRGKPTFGSLSGIPGPRSEKSYRVPKAGELYCHVTKPADLGTYHDLSVTIDRLVNELYSFKLTLYSAE
jgi:hypothetical protein